MTLEQIEKIAKAIADISDITIQRNLAYNIGLIFKAARNFRGLNGMKCVVF